MAESLGYDAVMVLGKELRRDRPRALRELGARCAAAAIAWRHGARRVISLEAPLQGQEEAGSIIAARLLRSLGVPDEAQLLERNTRSTREEAVGLLRVADDHGWGRLLAVTSAYHIPRSRRTFREVVGSDRVEVICPERLLALATPEERALILAGAPTPETMARECRVEAVFSLFARIIRPFPEAIRWDLEVRAGGLYRGIDGLRGAVRSSAGRSAAGA